MATITYSHLSNNYEDLEDNCYPTHQSIRIINKNVKRPRRGIDRWFRFDPMSINLIHIILRASMGKRFNDVYSKVCKRFQKKKNMRLRREFKDSVDFRYKPDGYNHYYLDEDGIIRRYPPRYPRVSETLKIPTSKSNTYYSVNCSLLRKYPEILDKIKVIFGKKTYYKILESGKVSQSTGDKLRNIIYRYFSNNGTGCVYGFMVNDFITRKEDVDYIEYTRGTKEFVKYYSEYFQAQKKRDRESKKEREKELSDLLQRIEYKRKMEALKLNEVTRDRLGFAKDSFTGEFYHGQKRKKRKSQNG